MVLQKITKFLPSLPRPAKTPLMQSVVAILILLVGISSTPTYASSPCAQFFGLSQAGELKKAPQQNIDPVISQEIEENLVSDNLLAWEILSRDGYGNPGSTKRRKFYEISELIASDDLSLDQLVSALGELTRIQGDQFYLVETSDARTYVLRSSKMRKSLPDKKFIESLNKEHEVQGFALLAMSAPVFKGEKVDFRVKPQAHPLIVVGPFGHRTEVSQESPSDLVRDLNHDSYFHNREIINRFAAQKLVDPTFFERTKEEQADDKQLEQELTKASDRLTDRLSLEEATDAPLPEHSEGWLIARSEEYKFSIEAAAGDSRTVISVEHQDGAEKTIIRDAESVLHLLRSSDHQTSMDLIETLIEATQDVLLLDEFVKFRTGESEFKGILDLEVSLGWEETEGFATETALQLHLRRRIHSTNQTLDLDVNRVSLGIPADKLAERQWVLAREGFKSDITVEMKLGEDGFNHLEVLKDGQALARASSINEFYRLVKDLEKYDSVIDLFDILLQKSTSTNKNGDLKQKIHEFRQSPNEGSVPFSLNFKKMGWSEEPYRIELRRRFSPERVLELTIYSMIEGRRNELELIETWSLD